MESEPCLFAKLSISVVALGMSTSLLYLKVVYQLAYRLAIKLPSDIIEISTAGLKCLVEDFLICVHIVILAMLLQAV